MRRSLLFAFLALSFTVAGHAESQDLILPIALNGYTTAPVHYQTTIRIVNMSSSAAEVTLEAYQNDGKAIRILELFPIPRTGTKTVFSIAAGGSVEAFTAEDVPSLNGWIRLTYDSSATIEASAEVVLINGPVGPHPICTRPSAEIVTSVQTQAVGAAQKFSGFAVIRPYRKSGYAIVNPSTTETATVFLSLLDFTGKFIAGGTVQVPPQGRVSRFVQELVPDAPSDFMGSLHITSSIPIGAGGVNILLPEGKFTGIDVASPPAAVCLQVLTPARNPLTNECRVFPTPCVIPDGWIRTASCNQIAASNPLVHSPRQTSKEEVISRRTGFIPTLLVLAAALIRLFSNRKRARFSRRPETEPGAPASPGSDVARCQASAGSA